MSESLGNSGTESTYTDQWFTRWEELNASMPRTEATEDEIEAARIELLKHVTFEDEGEAEACDDPLLMSAVRVLESPEGLAAYAKTSARYARIESILIAEGLIQPVVED